MEYNKYEMGCSTKSSPSGVPNYKEPVGGGASAAAGLFTELTKSINKLVSTERYGVGDALAAREHELANRGQLWCIENRYQSEIVDRFSWL